MSRAQEFWGYRRADGRVGVRNHVLVIAAMDNTNPVVRRVTAAVNGTIPIWASFGRGQRGEDQEQHDRTMIGLAANPNVFAALVVSLEPQSAKADRRGHWADRQDGGMVHHPGDRRDGESHRAGHPYRCCHGFASRQGETGACAPV